MQQSELISIVVTFFGLLCFAGVFTLLYFAYRKSTVNQIETGKRDIDLIDAAIKEKDPKVTRRRKAFAIVRTVLFVLFLVIIIPVLILSIIGKFTKGPVFDRGILVVASASMSQRNPVNTYLDTEQLDNQFNTYDVIVIQKVKKAEDLKQYDVIAYRNNEGTTIIHRIREIISVEDNSPGGVRFITRGDSNNSDDYYRPNLNDVVGVYTGGRARTMGIFVLFVQSVPGIVTIVAVIYCLFMIDAVSRKIEKAEQARIDQLMAVIDDLSDVKDLKAEYLEIIYYKGYEYHFNEKGFVKKSEVPPGEQTTEPNDMLKIIDDGASRQTKIITIETRTNDDKKQ